MKMILILITAILISISLLLAAVFLQLAILQINETKPNPITVDIQPVYRSSSSRKKHLKREKNKKTLLYFIYKSN